MQMDPVNQKRLLAMSDDRLWGTIRTIAARNGITLAMQIPDASTMQQIRIAIGNIGETDMTAAMQMLGNLQSKRGGGSHG